MMELNLCVTGGGGIRKLWRYQTDKKREYNMNEDECDQKEAIVGEDIMLERALLDRCQ